MSQKPPSDDSFSELFNRLPNARASQQPPEASSTQDAAAAAPASVPPAPSAVPLSRRAAREAAATGAQPVVGAADSPAPHRPDTPAAATSEDAAVAAPAAAPTLDALFAEAPASPKDKDDRKSRVAKWVVLAIVLAILGGIVAGGAYVYNQYGEQVREFLGMGEPLDYEAGQAGDEVVVEIVSGDTGESISRTLHEAGVTKESNSFYRYLIENGLNPSFTPGVFALQQTMTSEAALEAIENPENRRENVAQLREGLSVATTLPRLAEATGLPLADFEAAAEDPSRYGVDADSLEGWLFPSTYTFTPGTTVDEVMHTLVDQTTQALDDANVPAEDRHRILTIASIIEREARFTDDFYKVSTVIENRMRPDNDQTFGKLEMDSTVQYGYGQLHDGSVSTSTEARNDDNPWNTYMHPGLPKGPIANPGALAIDAAMNPVEGEWMFFVTVNLDSGETVFTNTYSEHLRYVEQWQQWCRDNPDSGC